MFSKRVYSFEIYTAAAAYGTVKKTISGVSRPRLPQSDCFGRLNFHRGEYKLVKFIPRIHYIIGTAGG